MMSHKFWKIEDRFWLKVKNLNPILQLLRFVIYKPLECRDEQESRLNAAKESG